MDSAVLNAVLLATPIAAPLLAALVYAPAGWRRATAHAGTAAAALILAGGIALAVRVTRHGPEQTWGGWLRADPLAAFMLLGIGTIATLACAASPGYLAAAGHGARDRAADRRYGVLVGCFLAAMSAAVLAGNLGLSWIAIEATTIVTAFLVGHAGTRAALEAAWKYTVICSVGIALALLGIVVLYDAARHAGLTEAEALNLPALAAHAHALDPAVTRMATVFLVLGFGAKAGLAPLHAWLPDAHGQAPAPVSALMSGVLLPVAFTQILRIKTVADAALGPAFTRTLLLVLGLATLALAALLLVAQRDYKRMLAYSTMENMGLITVGAAIGTPLAITAILLHIAGHGLAKAVAFTASGHLLAAEHTTRIDQVKNLAVRNPALAGIFTAAILALLGLPPFSLFASELGIARAAFAAHLGLPVAAAFALALFAFAALARHTAAMLLGDSQSPPQPGGTAATVPAPAPAPAVPLPLTARIPLITALAVVAALGVTAWPINTLLNLAAHAGH
ncbi:MAG TPA: proton-conducting transporter membrane subunit [Trebonia sp.]|nr:proton-conducting transporter membrane subunit [Trebonia sp.]